MAEQPIDRNELVRRERETERLEQLQDHFAALGSIRAARGVFLLILVLSLLVHLGAYSAAKWGGILRPLEVIQQRLAMPTTVPATAPATKPAFDADAAGKFSNWYYLTELMLPLAEFLGQVSCALLTVAFLFATLVALSGGLGGVRGSIAAFFWTLVLLAMLFPWSRWLGGEGDLIQVPGVYYTFAELRNIPTGFHTQLAEVLHYVRYLGYPLLALLIALTGNARFARGYRLVQRHLESRLKMKKV